MERITDMLQRPSEMTIPQRKIWEENQNLITGNLELVPPLYIRTHHYNSFRNIAVDWLIGIEGSHNTPWSYENINSFRYDAISFATDNASKKLDTHIAILNSPCNNNPADINLRLDYIGETYIERLDYQLSTFLYSFNFLLRAFKDKEQLVYLGINTDSICAACRGGVEGVGKHCLPSRGDIKRIREFKERLGKPQSKNSEVDLLWIDKLQETQDENTLALQLKYFFPDSTGRIRA